MANRISGGDSSRLQKGTQSSNTAAKGDTGTKSKVGSEFGSGDSARLEKITRSQIITGGRSSVGGGSSYNTGIKEVNELELQKQIAQRAQKQREVMEAQERKIKEMKFKEEQRKKSLLLELQNNQRKQRELINKQTLTLNERGRLQQLKRQENFIKRQRGKDLFPEVEIEGDKFLLTQSIKKGEETTKTQKLITKKLRGKTSKVDEALLVGLGFSTGIKQSVKGLIETPRFVKEIINNPSLIKSIPSSVKNGGVEFGELLRLNPSYALGRIGAEVFVIKGTSTSLRVSGKLTKQGINKLKGVKFTRLNKKLKFVPDKGNNPKFVVESVERIKRRKQLLNKKKIKQDRLSKREILEAEKGIVRDEVERLTEKLTSTFEDSKGIRFKTELREQFKKNVREKLMKQIENIENVNKTKIKVAASKKNFLNSIKKKLSKKINSSRFTKAGRRKKRLKRIKEIKRTTQLDREIDSFNIAQKEKVLNDLSEKLTIEFEKAQGIRFKTELREQFKKGIRKKLLNKWESSRKDILVKNIPSSIKKRSLKKLFNSVKKKIILSKSKRIKKVKKIKQERLRDIQREIKEKRFRIEKKEDLIKKLANKYEKVNGIRLNTEAKELLKEGIRKKLKKGKLNREKIQRLLDTKEPSLLKENRKVVKNLEKVSKNIPQKKIKTLRDFEKASDFADDLLLNGSGQRQKQVLLQKTKKVIKSKSKVKTKSRLQQKQLQKSKTKNRSRLITKQRSKLLQSIRLVIPSFKISQKSLSKQQSRILQLSSQSENVISKVLNGQDVRIETLQKVLQEVREVSRQIKVNKILQKTKKLNLPRKDLNLNTVKKISNKPSYYVAVYNKGKITKILRKPLSLEDAKDYLAYALDNNIVRTGFYVPAGRVKEVISIPNKMKGYFNNNQRKLRPYKIKQKQKKALLRGYIEKNRYISDTRGEKAQIRRSKRKITPKQRKVLLANLRKARAARKKKR